MTAPSASAAGDDLGRLGAYAADLVPDGADVGLGSGRAASAFVVALGARARAGLRVRGVPTSEATAALAREAGITLVALGAAALDLTVDGADEVDPRCDMIKGFGGALVRERVVAAASARQVILVTPDKLVDRLGARGRVPVEIVPFARPLCERRLTALGYAPRLRTVDGEPLVTDNGNLTLDLTVGPIADPRAMERDVLAVPGVVDTGLFLGTAALVLVAEPNGVRRLEPPRVEG